MRPDFTEAHNNRGIALFRLDRHEQALAAYESQLFQHSQSPDDAPPTKVSSREFLEAAEGRARHFGLGISAVYGEPFLSLSPLAVSDPWALLPQGSQ